MLYGSSHPCDSRAATHGLPTAVCSPNDDESTRNSAQGAHVLLYPEGMVRLSESAGAILTRCDGERTLGGVLDSLHEAFPGTDLEADVAEFLTIALKKGWIAFVGT